MIIFVCFNEYRDKNPGLKVILNEKKRLERRYF